MKKITLLIFGALVLMGSTAFAAEQETEEGELVFLGELSPKDVKNYIITFITGNVDFVTATQKVKKLADTSTKFRELVIESLINRFLKDPATAQAEFANLIETKKLNPFALIILKAAGADLNKKDNNGKTALIQAASEGDTETAQMLIDAGADLNIQDNKGNTALIATQYGEYKAIAQMLVDNGADLNKQNNDGNTALDLAELFGNTKMVAMLMAAMLKEVIKKQNQNKN